MVTALNAATGTQGNVANSITTAITFSDRFTISCTAATAIVRSIEVLNSTASPSLGFVVGQTTGTHVSTNLRLVATNTAVTATVEAAEAKINIVAGVNDTFTFKHVAYEDHPEEDHPSKTYTSSFRAKLYCKRDGSSIECSNWNARKCGKFDHNSHHIQRPIHDQLYGGHNHCTQHRGIELYSVVRFICCWANNRHQAVMSPQI